MWIISFQLEVKYLTLESSALLIKEIQPLNVDTSIKLKNALATLSKFVAALTMV